MKRILLLLAAMGFTFTLQGCAIYASPYGYGYSAGYYGYAPYWGFSYNYWPHSYYSYRPYYHHGFRPGHPWGGYYGGGGWGGGGHWGGRGGDGHWGGRGGWRGR